MSYESPIRIIENNLTVQLEDNIMTVVKSYGIKVNKDELLKALAYDREQYEEGYADGQRDERTAKVETVDTNSPHSQVYKCCKCGQYTHRTAWSRDVHYCPSCGAKLEWE